MAGPSDLRLSKRLRINVGGRVFETTLGTLQYAGQVSKLMQTVSNEGEEAFFDRDPDLFGVLLNILRTGKLPSKVDSSSLDKLIEEATYYGLVDVLKLAMAPPPLNGLDLQKANAVIPSGIDIPSALAPGSDGSLWLGHGSKITVFDWALRKRRTTLTEFNTIEKLHQISDNLVAAGASDLPGLHIYDGVKGIHAKSLIWTDEDDPRVFNPHVRAISSNETSVFASFESGQETENTVLTVDKSTLEITRELGRQNGGTGHAKAATKLQWLPSKNLLLVASVHGGAFGYNGYMRLWDVRTDKVVWDWKEPNFRNARVLERESFADVVANEELGVLFKVSILSGSVSLADLRHLDSPEPWLRLADSNPSLETAAGGANNQVFTYNKQLYVSRGADLEVWSEVPLADSFKELGEKEYWETSFRRNHIEQRRHVGQEVTHVAAGGNRLFVTRKDLQGVEVWETKV